MNAAVNLALALGVPFVVMIGVLVLTALMDEPSLARYWGYPPRAGVRRRGPA